MAELRPIPSARGYEASKDGFIYRRGRRLKGSTNGRYRKIKLSIANVQRDAYVHRLVCEAFHGAPTAERPHVRHLDGDCMNNAAHNLAWGSVAENIADMDVHGTRLHGSRAPWSKLTDEQVLSIRARSRAGEDYRALAKEFLLNTAHMHQVITGARYVHVPGAFPYRKPTKLSPGQVASIRADMRSTETELASAYGVSRSMIGLVRRGQCYRVK